MAKHELDLLIVKNPTDRSFSVKWGGIPYTLGPGQQTIWQRFVAEHFAKHLANDILLRKEQKHKADYIAKGGNLSDYKSVAYLNSKKHRPPVVDSILIGIYSYHQPGAAVDPAAMLQQQIDAATPGGSKAPAPVDFGMVDDDRTGGLVKTQFDDDDDEPETTPAARVPDVSAPPATQPIAPPVGPPVGPPPVTPAQPAPLPGGRPPIGQPVAQTPPQASQQPAGKDKEPKMPQLLAEAKKLGIAVPFGASKEQVKELILKEAA